jgi:hypothetical protein
LSLNIGAEWFSYTVWLDFVCRQAMRDLKTLTEVIGGNI